MTEEKNEPEQPKPKDPWTLEQEARRAEEQERFERSIALQERDVITRERVRVSNSVWDYTPEQQEIAFREAAVKYAVQLSYDRDTAPIAAQVFTMADLIVEYIRTGEYKP